MSEKQDQQDRWYEWIGKTDVNSKYVCLKSGGTQEDYAPSGERYDTPGLWSLCSPRWKLLATKPQAVIDAEELVRWKDEPDWPRAYCVNRTLKGIRLFATTNASSLQWVQDQWYKNSVACLLSEYGHSQPRLERITLTKAREIAAKEGVELPEEFRGLGVKQPHACANASDGAETKVPTHFAARDFEKQETTKRCVGLQECNRNYADELADRDATISDLEKQLDSYRTELSKTDGRLSELLTENGKLKQQLDTTSTNLELRTRERDEALSRDTKYHTDTVCGSCGGPLEVSRDVICEKCAPEPFGAQQTTLPIDREALGMIVRSAWVKWAQQQAAPKPSWVIPWDELCEDDKEADRCVGEAVTRYVLATPLLAPSQTKAMRALDEMWMNFIGMCPSDSDGTCLGKANQYHKTLKAFIEQTDPNEKKRRVYYQDIVYDVCAKLDSATGRGPATNNSVMCGCPQNPLTEVQDVLREVLANKPKLCGPAMSAGEFADMVDRVCKQCGAWSDHGLPLRMWFNMNVQSLADARAEWEKEQASKSTLCGPSFEMCMQYWDSLRDGAASSTSYLVGALLRWLLPNVCPIDKVRAETADKVRAETHAEYVHCANCDCLVPRASTKQSMEGKPICIDYAIRSGCRLMAERQNAETTAKALAEELTASNAKIAELKKEAEEVDKLDKERCERQRKRMIELELELKLSIDRCRLAESLGDHLTAQQQVALALYVSGHEKGIVYSKEQAFRDADAFLAAANQGEKK